MCPATRDKIPAQSIEISHRGPIRCLSFDSKHYQSKVDVRNPVRGHFDYINLFFQTFLFKPDARYVLMIGLGGASTQRLFHHYRPELSIHTVELDPVVVEIAIEHFFFDNIAMPVTISDGRKYLAKTRRKFDIIIQDAFRSTSEGTFIPYHLATREYFELAWSRLTRDGVFAINLIGSVLSRKPGNPVAVVYRTISDAFPSIYMFQATDTRNLVLIATKSKKKHDKDELAERADALFGNNAVEMPRRFAGAVRSQMVERRPLNAAKSEMLTDRTAPPLGFLI
jgi:spermidine synthase